MVLGCFRLAFLRINLRDVCGSDRGREWEKTDRGRERKKKAAAETAYAEEEEGGRRQRQRRRERVEVIPARAFDCVSLESNLFIWKCVLKRRLTWGGN